MEPFIRNLGSNLQTKRIIVISVIYLLSPSSCNRHVVLNTENELQLGDGTNFLNGAGGVLGSGSANFNNFVETINNVNANTDQCIINYEINEGIIIRTKDSLAKGAKYLNESDLGTNIKSKEECLRICCQTPHCNVITYEEKNSGSCYLFDCGPLEDFQCKFTQQDRYMSALLRRREEPFQLTITGKNNQHEAELNQLRNVEASNNVFNKNSNAEHLSPPANVAMAENINHYQHANQQENKQNTMTGVAGGAQEFSAALHQKQQQSEHADKNPPSKCSRWQFECKTTKDCIAIYNACDGVAQCPDGSDEAAELHCPSVDQVLRQQQKDAQHGGGVPHTAAGSASGVSGNSGVGDSPLLLDKGLPPTLLSSSRAEDLRLSQLHQQQQQLLQPPNSRGGIIVDKGYSNFDNGNVNAAAEAIDHQHNIFNHKDGGILDEAYGSQSQQQQQALLQQQRRLQQQLQQNPNPYWKSYDYNNADMLAPYGPPVHNPSTYGGVSNYGYLPPYSPGFLTKDQGGGQQLLPNTPLMQPSQLQYNNNMQLSLENQQQQLQQQQQQQPFFNPNPMFNGGLHATPISAMLPPQLQVKGTSSPTTTSATTTASAPTTKKSTQQNSQTDQNQKLDDDETRLVQSLLQKSALAAASNPALQIDKDAIDNAPGGGAIFAFIIGIAMSIMMILILGCRFRHRKSGVRRRGKNRLDPDYLVDGMYL